MSAYYARLPHEEEAAAAHITALTTDDWKKIQATMRRRVSGVFSSWKMNCSIPWRKLAERDLLGLLEVDPTVDSFHALPHRVELFVERKVRFYFPGFEVRSGGHQIIMDALSPRESLDPVRADLTQVLAGIYRRQGMRYCAVPPSEVLLEPRFSNAQFILRCRGYQADPETRREVIGVLSDGVIPTIAEIEEALASRAYVAETVCTMMFDGTLNLELSAPEPRAMRASLRLREGV